MRKLRPSQKDTLVDIVFLAPQFIVFFSLTILPFFVAIPLAFTDTLDMLHRDAEYVGLSNFVAVLSPPLVRTMMPVVGRTALFAVLNYAMVYLFGLTLALLMYELTHKIRKTFFTIIYLPYMVAGLAIGMLFMVLFSRDTGSANLLLLQLGIIKRPIDITDPTTAAVLLPVLVGWRFAGFNMALFLAGLLAIPTDTIEAAIVDGAKYFQRLRRIYLPQMVPTLTIVTIFCMIGSFGIFDEPVGLGALQGRPTVQMLSILLYRIGFGGSGSRQAGTLSQAVAMSLIVYVPLIIIAVFLNRLQKRLQY